MDMVSIVIPLYNGEKFIGAALDSCLEQTYQNVEIVVCDDCSTDHGIETVESYVKKNRNIRLICNEENLGMIRTTNKAISYTNGEYVLVFGQDDLLPREHIQKMMKCFEHDTALVFCDYTIINERSVPVHTEVTNHGRNITSFDLALKNCLHSCGLISRKSYLEKAGYYTFHSLWKNYGEWELWIKMSQFGTLKYCPETLALYRRHSANMTNEFKNKRMYKIHREYCLYCMRLAKELTAFNFSRFMIYYVNFGIFYLKSLFHAMRLKEKGE